MMVKTTNIEGKKFGRLTGIAPSGNKNYKGSILWNFQCECGNVIERECYPVTSGTTKSCGCFSNEVRGKASITHGKSGSKEYYVWNKLVKRIIDPSNENYEAYGGAGLSISPEFVADMDALYNYLGPLPDDKQRWTVGRIDNNLGYIYGNLRWETYKTQAKNKSKKVTNSSGITGVVWTHKTKLCAQARWQELDGRQGTKSFSVSKHGLLPAFAKACVYREEMIAKLNSMGADYSPNHGK